MNVDFSHDPAQYAVMFFRLCIIAQKQRVLDFIDHALHGLAAERGEQFVRPSVKSLFVDLWRCPKTVEFRHSLTRDTGRSMWPPDDPYVPTIVLASPGLHTAISTTFQQLMDYKVEA